MAESFVPSPAGGGAAPRAGGEVQGTAQWTFDEARSYARSFGFASEAEYKEYRCPGAYALPRDPEARYPEWRGWDDFLSAPPPPKMENVLFVETGFGCDGHGQDATKAALRAARNAIEFNSIPCVDSLVPGGRDGLKLKLDLALPEKYHNDLDWSKVRAAFPYGDITEATLQVGGAIFQSGIAIPELGDSNQDMLVAIIAVTVGY
eukprot:CAMPEP_0118903702 /NCGR_PEP_ID=MMETSP1166-20130328/8469_1 /TAXON_ID=1104430 /ORGANISM="Chrysoreinhardia sp, Strain CCMP3193" /LENGTH=204 /DNA_ID=CAMNT_0006842935 /DNA_START=109 /DNA_END=723 /DNA_ORIENTATION=+